MTALLHQCPMDGIFLHTSWRSTGTSLWQQLRVLPGHMGFYEPLHELLPTITPADIARLHGGSWNSRHPAMERPYFHEYTPLLAQAGPTRRTTGVQLAQLQFSFERYVLTADDRNEPLRAYIENLCAVAQRAGKKPVLKFTRSQARLPWFVANFAQMHHTLLVRQPWGGFLSSWRCLVEDANPYFFAAPLLVLERNAAHPMVRAVVEALEIPLPWLRLGGMGWRFRHFRHLVRALAPQVLYKALFGFWLINTLCALPAASHIIDGDDPPEALAASLGLKPAGLPRPPCAKPQGDFGFHMGQLSQIHQTALRAAMAVPGAPPAPWVWQRVEYWLAQAELSAARVLARAPQPKGVSHASGVLLAAPRAAPPQLHVL